MVLGLFHTASVRIEKVLHESFDNFVHFRCISPGATAVCRCPIEMVAQRNEVEGNSFDWLLSLKSTVNIYRLP